MAVDILIIRNNCDPATAVSNWLGEGLKDHLVEKGYSVKDLNGPDASRQNVENWLNISDSKTKKLVIGFDHGNNDNFFGEFDGQVSPVIDQLNVARLGKRIHVYTFACSTNIDQGLGQSAINNKCYSWLGYTNVIWGMQDETFKQCIWSYIDAFTDGKTLNEAERALRESYQRNINRHPTYRHNLDLLRLRTFENRANMTINMGRCELITDPNKIEIGHNYIIMPLVTSDLKKVLTIKEPNINGSHVCQSIWRNADEQKWRFFLDDECYFIRSASNNRCLDVEGKSSSSRANILSYDCNGDSNQKWKITHADDIRNSAFKIESKHSGKVLDVPNSSTDDVDIIQFGWNKGANQQWIIYQLD